MWHVEDILRHVLDQVAGRGYIEACLDEVASRGYIEACPRPGGR